MSLGYSVEELVPAARVAGPLRMGLVKLAPGQWRDPAPDLAARAAAFDACPGSVVVLPEAEAGIAELADMLGAARTTPAATLEACARSGWEDLCVMVQDAPGQPFRLGAAAVGFPTDWRIADKIGKPVHAVHEPIHGYAEQLSSGVDRFMDGLQSFNIFGRTNVFVLPSGDLRYMPTLPPAARFAHVTADNAGETLFARCEREALRRLPRSRAIIFTIGIYRAPLAALGDAVVARVAETLDGYGEGEGDRRAAPFYANALSGYAARRMAAKAA